MAGDIDTVAAVRRFNRFYTRAIGVLDRAYLGGPYSLAENRVLYEIFHGDGITPKAIGAALDLDAGYLSRMLGRLQRDGLVERTRSKSDGRSVILRLTEAGRDFYADLDRRTVAQVETLIGELSRPQKATLAQTLGAAEALLDTPKGAEGVVLRQHAPGDMGWVVEQHALVYGREYGWGPGIEAVTARICADFLENLKPDRERCWIAERGSERLGSVFLVRETDDVARLRLLLLVPAARGLKLGRRLADECVGFARSAGYSEIVLWTHQVLTAARSIYAAVGFELVETWIHDEFGKPEVSETWRLKL